MKKVIIPALLMFLFTGFGFAQEKVKWMSMNEALEAQKKVPKKIIIDAYTDWCGPCKLMDRKTFGNQDVADYLNEHYYPVKFNAEGNEEVIYKGESFGNPNYDPNRAGRRNSSHSFARLLKVNAYPTVVFLDEEANLLTPVVGYRTPSQIELFLKLFATDTHKTVASEEDWKNFQTNFKSEFRE